MVGYEITNNIVTNRPRNQKYKYEVFYAYNTKVFTKK